MMTQTANRLFNLPQEIQNVIFEYARDDSKKKQFNKDFNLYFKMYKSIKETFDNKTRFYLKNDDEEDNKHFMLYLNNGKEIRKFYINIKTNEELEEELNDYLNENIIYIYNDVDFYERCLKNEYYNKNDFRNGIKQSITRKIKMHIANEENEKLFNMLDLETFKHNYFMHNSLCDVLNYYNIEEIKILENGELPNTKKLTTYNIMIQEY